MYVYPGNGFMSSLSSPLGYDDGHYYTHLGSGSSPDDLRVKLEKRCVHVYHVCMYV